MAQGHQLSHNNSVDLDTLYNTTEDLVDANICLYLMGIRDSPQLCRLLSKCIVLMNVFKGELRNSFNLISEERVKFCEQNSENLMKIG